MKAIIRLSVSIVLLSIGSVAAADVFFEEQFNATALDPSVWRTEILTSGPRFCCDTTEPWSPGHWVGEAEECHGVVAQSPYGTAILPGGLLQMSSSNGRAFPVLVSRLPGSVEVFPPSGDFTLTLRLRFDRVTPWGVGVVVFQTQSTEPSGTLHPAGGPEHIVLQLTCDNPGGGIWVNTFLGGSYELVGEISPATEFHEFVLDCVGTLFTISADGTVIYGPVSSGLRPTAVTMGNALLAFWYPTDWTSFSIDSFRVEVPGPVPVASRSWGAIKALYR
jgi:hypothetical protein